MPGDIRDHGTLVRDDKGVALVVARLLAAVVELVEAPLMSYALLRLLLLITLRRTCSSGWG